MTVPTSSSDALRRRPSWRSRFLRRLGRRGTILLVVGIFDELYALALPGADSIRSAGGQWLASVAPLDAWAAVWAVAGLVVIAGAVAVRDEWAYFTATGLKIMWSAVYLIGWSLHGVYRGWVQSIVWMMVATCLLVISYWPEQQAGP